MARRRRTTSRDTRSGSVAFHPAGGKLRAAMRTAKTDDMGRAGFAAVERKALAHDLDGSSFAGPKFFGAMDRIQNLRMNLPARVPGRVETRSS